VTRVSSRPPRVLLADGHPIFLMGLRKFLEPNFEVIGEVTDGRALLAAAASGQPDLVVVDIAMPKIDGIEATRRLGEIAPGAGVLVLSVHAELSWVKAAFAAGARAYLSKTAVAEELELALAEVHAGRSYVSPGVARPPEVTAAGGERPADAWRPGAPLTPREHDVIRLVGRGRCNKEIAKELGVSVTTVRTHLNRIYGKLAPGSRVELALLAARGGAHRAR
jgi:DNA-binding NarL/FixJ family response regulator